MRESIPIAARLFMMGWKVGNSHSAQTTTLGYTRPDRPAPAFTLMAAALP